MSLLLSQSRDDHYWKQPKLELDLGYGYRSRFVFGCLGWELTEEKVQHNRGEGSVRKALLRSRAEHKIFPQIFFFEFTRHGREGYQGQKVSLFNSTGK